MQTIPLNFLLRKAVLNAFPGLTPERVETVFEHGELFRCDAKTIITEPADKDNSLYICLSGVVKVNYVSAEGDVLSLVYLRQGQLFGELSALDGEVRSAHCIAKTDCTLLKISAKKVWELIDCYADFNRALLRLLAKRLRQSNDHLYSIGKHSAPQRVADVLINLGQQNGPNQMNLGFVPTHQEIGLLALVSREQTSRVMSEWQKAGLVVKEDEDILITNIKKLQQSVLSE